MITLTVIDVCSCLLRNFQLLSFGEEAEEDEKEVTEVAQVHNRHFLKSCVIVFKVNTVYDGFDCK